MSLHEQMSYQVYKEMHQDLQVSLILNEIFNK